MRVEEVAQELGISKSHAYKVIHKLNAELRDKGLSDHLRAGQSELFHGEVLLRQDGKVRANHGSLQGRKNQHLAGSLRYTDWNGERKQTQKRGFKTKREAQAWERGTAQQDPAPIWI